MPSLDGMKHVLDAINVYAPTIQAFGVIIALIAVAVQAKQIGKQIKLASRTVMIDYNREVNTLFLSDENAKKLGSTMTRDDVLGFILMNGYQARYRLWMDGLIDDKEWGTTLQAIENVLRLEFVQTFWSRHSWQYEVDLVDKVIARILSQAVATAPASANPAQIT